MRTDSRTIDTAATVRNLEAAGVERKQAEAIAAAVRTASEAGRDDLATKTDLAVLEASLKAELTWRMVIMAGVIIAAVKLIP